MGRMPIHVYLQISYFQYGSELLGGMFRAKIKFHCILPILMTIDPRVLGVENLHGIFATNPG
jgi:hypothetical protein